MKFPKYVKMIDKRNENNPIYLCLDGDEYYRYAGCWAVGVYVRENRMYSKDLSGRHPQLENNLLVKATKKEHDKDNDGYLP